MTKIRSYLVCPECGFPMVLFTSKEARYPKSGELRKYYRCANIKECDIVCGAHSDGTPLGIPGNEETRSARSKLHSVFDQLWFTGRWSRREAYIILQLLTGLEEEKAHIACFNKDQCEQAEEQIREFMELNPIRSNGKPTLSNYRFVNIKKECSEHGLQVHRVYLKGRETFCQLCLNTGRGQVWREFLLFERSS